MQIVLRLHGEHYMYMLFAHIFQLMLIFYKSPFDSQIKKIAMDLEFVPFTVLPLSQELLDNHKRCFVAERNLAFRGT